ncbi:MAG: hypothetical protein HUJ78_06520, partial [Mogibacterium sp.]|nr:hypothetical protein [Mogibacterium sp.]
MFGWIATTENLSNMDAACIENTQLSKIGKYTFIMNNNRRFPKDVVFLETEKYFYLIDGVVLNRVELEEEYGCEFKDVVQKLYAEGGDLLPGSLRGCFTGCVLDKESEELFAFTNQTADGGLFYSTDKKIFGNNFEWILHVLRAVGAEVSLDEQAVLYMCTFGYMLDSTTYAKNVKRAMPGECFKLADSLEKHYYHKFDNTKTINMTEQEYIEHIDFLYRRAIKREFDKDAEYGYTSIVDLSGGLDCRMINYVAKSMGYKNIVNVSFSQVYSDEYKAMIELSRNLGFRLFHYPLDNARHLFDVDKITKHNYGLSIYSGAGAMMSVMENLSFSYYGLEHGGIMGDMAEGIFPGGEYTEHVAPTFEEGMPICRILGFDDLDPAVIEEF